VRRHFRGRFRQHQWRERHLQSSLFTPDSSLLSNHAALKPEGAIICTSNSGYEPPRVRTANEMLPSPIWFSGSGVSSRLPCTDLDSSRAGKGNDLLRQHLRNRPTFFLSLTSHLRY